ncbi:FG-GAP repeat protein, partial [Planktomarina temperata]|nr:FG-GAP repeat protein [Planktomarina temperata]
MTAKLLKNKLNKKTPLLMSPFGFALAACGGGGGSEQSEESVSSQPPSAKLKSSLHSFQESESSEGWWYAGEYNSPQLISYFPQAVGVVDIASDGDLDVIIPLNKGYRTGIDTRHHFTVLENIDGTLEFSSEMTNSTPFVTGARRLETFHLDRLNSDVLVTVAHDTAIEAETRDDIPWRMGDLTFTDLNNFQDISSGLIPDNTLPKSFQTGRESAVNAHSLAVGDINGDGLEDILVGEMNSAFILYQTETGPFTFYTDTFLSNLGWNYRDPSLD